MMGGSDCQGMLWRRAGCSAAETLLMNSNAYANFPVQFFRALYIVLGSVGCYDCTIVPQSGFRERSPVFCDEPNHFKS
eukprot:2487229-Rhodomonas_salina.7